jgi:fatty-acyl-CoA synthase
MIGGSFGRALDGIGRAYPSETALIDGDLRLTYAQLFGRVRATGRALLGRGLQPGDRVAFLLADSPALLEVMYGALWAGLSIVPLNTRLGIDDHLYVLHDADVRALVFDAANAERGHALLAQTDISVVLATTDDAVPRAGSLLSRLVDTESNAPGAPEVNPASECWIQYTGGTTGRPKGVRHSHLTMLTALYSCALELDVRAGEVAAHVAPLTHSGIAYVVPVWSRGGANVLLGGFDPDRLLHAIEAHRVTATLMVPTMLYRFVDHAAHAGRDLTSLRTVTYGAAPIGPERLEQALDVLGPVLLQIYGQTEAPLQLSVLTKRDHLLAANTRPELLRSCGRPVAVAEIRCADQRGVTVADGEPGEILARGAHITLGYLNKPQESTEALRDGWLHTGDIGIRDEHGYLYIVDRSKDMIISGGFNIYPKEIEQLLFQHPGVADACVIGVPDATWGEAVKAIVVTTSENAPTASELITFVKQRKGGVLAPKSVEFVDAIPVTPLGKHDKRLLRQNATTAVGR